jgi:hypothetical protein
MKLLKSLLCTLAAGSVLVAGIATAEDFPSGADVARDAMIRAQAEKERNDRIVEQQRAEQQRAAEKAAKPTPSPTPTPSPK